MAKIKFPYTFHCPSCKVGIKVKKEEQIGKRISCPKCGKKIEVLTPEEDGHVPYGITAAPEPEAEPEPTEEELEQKELDRRKEKRKQNLSHAKYVGGIMWLLLLLGVVGGVFYKFVVLEGYMKREPEKPLKGPS